MLRRDNDLCVFWVGDEIHCAAHAPEELAWDHEVGEVAGGTDLEGLRVVLALRFDGMIVMVGFAYA